MKPSLRDISFKYFLLDSSQIKGKGFPGGQLFVLTTHLHYKDQVSQRNAQLMFNSLFTNLAIAGQLRKR